jgi:cytochrome c oxidase assembly protein subunit 15
VAVAAATFLLVCAGGLVTSTGSGLAVPDWPLSFGQVLPRMEGGVLFEHGHRMIAAGVGLLTVVLAVWMARVEPRGWVRGLAWAALGAVVLQGTLGGLTVLMKLPDAVSVAHAGLAQVFFSITVVLALATSPRWEHAVPRVEPAGGLPTRTLALLLVIAVYAQTLLGAVVRHTGAGLAIPDFPLAYGRLLPPFTSSLIGYHFAHRVGAVVVVALLVWVAFRVVRRHGSEALLRRPALLLVVLAAWQLFLGALTIWTRRAVVPTTAHVATGALLLATSVALAVRVQRLIATTPRVEAAPERAPAALG